MRTVTVASELGAPRGTRAVVMTMGALHEGHLTLVRHARSIADEVLVTVFVNPLQFDDPADLERYPRTLGADAALLEAEGVDVLYAPALDDVYPGGVPIVTVAAGAINEVFEGAARPGHFDGVLTVVLKLMNLTRPDVAVFGAKDAQQVIAVRTMVRDLNVPVEIAVAPTVRDDDGLARSSRNVFLSASERDDALVLARALRAADAAAGSGAAVAEVIRAGEQVLADTPAVVVEYFAALDPASAQPVADDYRGDAVIAVAARVGKTRLIDNVATHLGQGSSA
ncbi:pantoate--beta-alanine ligase [Demequina aurantiaca]|uniref:pantoate--beta-alanine ligase n=1 Tax=Demequina aurantiaca TaxID=676200 RepID=UPI000784F6E4|nr:pantoate--beta-alanine ligase [Demequina aurantiaca]